MKMRRISLIALFWTVVKSQDSLESTSALRSTSAAPLPNVPQCKIIPGDKEWPADDVWKQAIPGVVKSGPVAGNDTRPDWVVNARGPAEIKAAIKFAAKHNIRVSVYNSGHDFLGRNDAPNGLWINTLNLKGCQAHEEFTATEKGMPPVNYTSDCAYGTNAIKPVPGKQAAYTFGVGVSGQELVNGMDKSALNTITGATSTVSVAGGFAQMGGHGPLSPTYGLAADLILEWQVVTPDGELVIANSKVNTDLYNALRGGGGGTFGVVVQATMKAFPTPPIQIIRYWLRAKSENDTTSIYEPAAYLHRQFSSLSQQGMQGYYYILPYGLVIGMMKPYSNETEARKLWEPLFAKLESFPNMQKGVYSYKLYGSYREFNDLYYGPLTPYDPSAPPDVEPPAPRGNANIDSWLLGPKALDHSDLAAALKASMPNMKNGMLRGHLLSGGKVHDKKVAEETNVNPAWRTALAHIIATGEGGVPNVTAIKQLEVSSGSYGNEDAGCLEPHWKQRMWGDKYQRLYEIKQKYDPKGLFWVTPGIGADDYTIYKGRLCRVEGLNGFVRPENPMSFAPLSDNRNPYRLGHSEVPFINSQEVADILP